MFFGSPESDLIYTLKGISLARWGCVSKRVRKQKLHRAPPEENWMGHPWDRLWSHFLLRDPTLWFPPLIGSNPPLAHEFCGISLIISLYNIIVFNHVSCPKWSQHFYVISMVILCSWDDLFICNMLYVCHWYIFCYMLFSVLLMLGLATLSI